MQSLIKTLVASLALLLSQQAFSAQLLDKIVAVINDEIILHSELEQRLDLTKADLRQRGVPLPGEAELAERVLDSMVLQTIQLQRANLRGIEATDEEINAQLMEIANANNISLFQLRDEVNKETPDGFNLLRKQFSEQIIIQKLREIEIIGQTHVTEDELNNFLQRQKLQENQNEYNLAHILITRPDTPTPEQRKATEDKVQKIYQELKAGADFAQMAVRHSEGSKALNGGELGWLTLDQIPSFFAGEILTLEAGQLSKIIESPSGYHLVKLLEKRSNNQQASELEAQQAIQAIRIRKANENFDLWLRRLKDEAFIDIRLADK